MISIVKKPKSVPKCPHQHDPLVPLRVVDIREERLREVDRTELRFAEHIRKGDILVMLPALSDAGGVMTLLPFNVTKGEVVQRRYFEGGAVLCLRAHDVQQVIICNDDTPAPVE